VSRTACPELVGAYPDVALFSAGITTTFRSKTRLCLCQLPEPGSARQSRSVTGRRDAFLRLSRDDAELCFGGFRRPKIDGKLTAPALLFAL
jgi:hypothetical protein